MMMRRTLLPLLTAALLAPLSLTAQDNLGANIWGTALPEGEYLVAIDSILSISKHEYIVDGAAKVTEVNIATSSPVVVRYYYLDIITPETPGSVGKSVINRVTELAKEAAGKTPVSELKVIKNYPHSTHAKTVEFRIGSSEELEAIYQSARKAFSSKRGSLYQPKKSEE